MRDRYTGVSGSYSIYPVTGTYADAIYYSNVRAEYAPPQVYVCAYCGSEDVVQGKKCVHCGGDKVVEKHKPRDPREYRKSYIQKIEVDTSEIERLVPKNVQAVVKEEGKGALRNAIKNIADRLLR